MHEAKVAQYAFEIIKEALEKTPAVQTCSCSGHAPKQTSNVTKITFGVGKPNTVMRDSFELYFLELIKGTRLEKAKLVYEDSSEEGFFVSSIEVDDGN
jgi:Zn finger protein HypA/HybF involved in hydrogenase expression